MIDILQKYGLIFLVGQWPEGPMGGLGLTLFLALCGLVFAFPLAVLMGVARVSRFRLVYWPVSALVHTIRGLPVLMIIFWAYFVVPLVIGQTVSGVTTVICALVAYETAFMAEIVRAGILSIPPGQVEASRSLGLNYFKTMRRVVLPQALYQMLPSILNQFINLIKNTSLGYIISVNELTYSAYQVNAQLLTKPFQVYAILALVYFLICYSMSRLTGLVERRIAARRSPVQISGAA
jgi:polar amino acid transport system permease protein